MIPLDYLQKKYGSLPPGYAVEPSMGVMPEDYATQPAVDVSPAQRLSEPESDAPYDAPPMVQAEPAPVDPMAAAIETDRDRRFGRNAGTVRSNFLARLLRTGEPIRGIEAAPSEEARQVGAETREQKTLRDALQAKYDAAGLDARNREAGLRAQEIKAREDAAKTKAEADRRAALTKEQRDAEDAKFAREKFKDESARGWTGIKGAEAERGLKREELGLAKEEKKASKEAELEITSLDGGETAQAATVEEAKALRNAKPEVVGLRRNLDELAGLVKQHGVELAPGPAKARMEFLLKDVQLKAKGPAMYQLGVLSGPDMEILNQVTGDPTSLRAFGGGGADAIAEKMRGFSETVAQGYQDKFDSHRRGGSKSEQAKALEGASTKPATVDTSFSPRREPRTMRLPSGEIVEVE
jgi:hypothetical protein